MTLAKVRHQRTVGRNSIRLTRTTTAAVCRQSNVGPQRHGRGCGATASFRGVTAEGVARRPDAIKSARLNWCGVRMNTHSCAFLMADALILMMTSVLGLVAIAPSGAADSLRASRLNGSCEASGVRPVCTKQRKQRTKAQSLNSTQRFYVGCWRQSHWCSESSQTVADCGLPHSAALFLCRQCHCGYLSALLCAVSRNSECANGVAAHR